MKWTISFTSIDVHGSDLTFHFTIVCRDRLFIKTMEFPHCSLKLDSRETRQSVVDYMDKEGIIGANDEGEAIQREIWFGDIGIVYIINPHYDPVFNVYSPYENLVLETDDPEIFWAFHSEFCKLGELFLSAQRSFAAEDSPRPEIDRALVIINGL